MNEKIYTIVVRQNIQTLTENKIKLFYNINKTAILWGSLKSCKGDKPLRIRYVITYTVIT